MDTTTAESIITGTQHFWAIVLTLAVVALSVGLPFLVRPGSDCRAQYKGPNADN
jgi:hypothetical protein